MERATGSGSGTHHHHYPTQHAPGVGHTYIAPTDEHIGKSSFDNPATKKKPPKLKSINRSISIAIDNYAPPPPTMLAGAGGSSQHLVMEDPTMIIEQPLIHRSASPVAHRSAPPQTLSLSPATAMHGGGGSGAVSPALSARQHHYQRQHQPDIYLVSSNSLSDDVGTLGGGGGGTGGSASPIQFIDDYMLPPGHHHRQASQTATHPLKKTTFRRSDTIDVHPASTFQMKKTHSFHVQHDNPNMDLLLTGTSQGSSASSSRRTSSVRANFLMPGHPSGKDISRSPSPSRRGCRSYRSFNDPTRRPSNTKPESVVESQIRHPSLNDDLMEPMEGRALFTQANLSLENELFVESRSRSGSHTKMEDVGAEVVAQRSAAAAMASIARKSSGSFEDHVIANTTHPSTVATTSSLKKRDHSHSRQQSSHSLELDGRPSTSAAAAAAASHPHPPHTLQLHSAAAAATAAYHFKRGAQHGRSLYLSPKNLEELPVHRPSLLAAAAAFQGTNASAKQAKALHSASMRLRTYRETLSASKKSKSFIGDGNYPPPIGNEFELTSPHRRNSRPLSSAVGASGSGVAAAVTIEDIKRSPRPISSAFIEEKRPSFERKPSLTYELSDAAFEQVLRPFHHKVAGRKASMSGTHKGLKKKSLSDETDEDSDEADRKRKRIVCIVMTVFLCLVCASVFVVIVTLTHSSGQSHHHHQSILKKTHTYSRETPVHYNVRQENERLMKETMERGKFGKNFTETSALISTATQLQNHVHQIP